MSVGRALLAEASRAGVTPPTASEHLRVLTHVGLIKGKRIRQWTFYRRDEKRIAELKRLFPVEP